jgi:hypothetical protein
VTHGLIFRSRLPLKHGLESIFIQPRHRSMYWNACTDRQTIPGSEIGRIPWNVTMKCDLTWNVTWRKIVSEETRLAWLF